MNDTSYDVRFIKTRVYKGRKVTTYYVRWKVDGKEWQEPFRNVAQADSFRSELVTAARKGEAFGTETGRPVSWNRAALEMSWYEFACKYTDMKWPAASAKYRRDIARALNAATPAMIPDDCSGRPADATIRLALHRWAFNSKQRCEAPADVATVLTWLSRNTMNVSALATPSNARRVLDAAISKIDGKPAAATTARRHRTILANALDYAKELGTIDIPANPIRALKWRAPKTSTAVDRRSVVNPRQARALLAAVRAQHPSGPRLVAFFGTIYYAGLRPEETVNLGKDNITFPLPDSDGWGELEFESATPDAGREWTDDGEQRDHRQLKHRATGESRTVPAHPELVALLRSHIDQFGTAPDGKLFTGIRGGDLPTITYRRAWIAARKTALTPEEQKSPLARRIYDLRHACLSTWLNGGVAPTQVAEWAGHSVEVLLRIYAKCIDGQHEIAKRRISEALRTDKPDASAPADRDASHGSAQDASAEAPGDASPDDDGHG